MKYIDKYWYSHTRESLIDFMWEDELNRRVKMWDLIVNK